MGFEGIEPRDRVSEHVFEPLTTALSRRAELDRPAFTFVDYGESRDGVEYTLTWAELTVRARAVAARLGQLTEPGQRVAILCPQNLDYVVGFLASLYAGVIGVPLFAPEVSAHGARLVGALADCDPEVWLTSSSTEDSIRELANAHPVPQPKHVLAVDTVDGALAEEFRPVSVHADEPAYLQYTSGSTRRPAGAVITHRAVAANVRQVVRAFGTDEHGTSVGWLPFFHDMGLIQLICLPVHVGCRSVFTTPYAFTRRPTRWLRLLGRYPNVITAAPNFAYEYAAARLSDQDRESLDLSGVRVAINGAEPVRASTIEAFLAATGPLGFAAHAHRPSYGLAEATVFVSSTPAGTAPTFATLHRDELAAGRAVPVDPGHDKALRLVTAGVPVGQRVSIVDPETGRIRPDGEVGEVWVHGPNVATGYWRQPERSAECFDGRLFGAAPGVPERGWLRTGDLGVVYGGELFITGRLKDLIILDGKNHYPQDIEATAQEAHPAIRRDRLAVFSIERDGHEGPVVVAEFSQHVPAEQRDPEEVGRAVRAAVAQHHDLRLLDFVLVRPGSVLRTSSGKIARSATRQRYLEGALRTDGGTR